MVSGMDRFLADFNTEEKPTSVKENTIDKEIRAVQNKFIHLMKTHAFLSKSSFYSSIQNQIARGKTLTGAQAKAVRTSLEQWENKDILLYLKLVSKYPFLKETDKANAYDLLISGAVLNENQLKWVTNCIREIRKHKGFFDAQFKQKPDFKYNLQLYQLIVENKNIPDNELGYIVSKLEDKWVILTIKIKRLYIRKYMRQYKNTDGFYKQLYVFLNKGIPMTGKQFEKIEEVINLTNEEIKKDIPITLPARRNVRSY